MRHGTLATFGVVSLATALTATHALARTPNQLPFEPVVPVIPADVVSTKLPFEPTPGLMPVSRFRASKAGRTNYLDVGDLPEIQRRKRLRVLMLREQAGELGDQDIGLQRDLIRGYAREADMSVDWVWIDTPAALQTALAQGRGDVVIGDVPLDGIDMPSLNRTVALRQVRYMVVTRAADEHIDSRKTLWGLRAGLSKSSPTASLLERWSAGHPAIHRVFTEGLSQDETLQQLAAGRFDFTVVESDGSPPGLRDRTDLRVAFELTGSQPVSWLVRGSNPELREGLNHYLNKNRLALRTHPAHKHDLDRIRERGVLRIITRPDTDNFFISKGERAGFEYDMIREFCLRNELRIEAIVADSDEQMLAWLDSGVGDVVTARVDSRLVDEGTGFAATRMYHYVAPVLVGRADLVNPTRLADRRILLPRDSIFTRMLKQGGLRAARGAYTLVETDPGLSTVELVDAVAAGEGDYTVVEAPRLKELLRRRAVVLPLFSLRESRPYRFTVRAANTRLRGELDEFLRNEYGTEFYNAARRRYFDNEELYALQGAGFDSISPYDNLVKRYAERYAFDWRLIVAQMYEESRFDADAVSSAGARGLMQVLPLTARSLGFRSLDKPELGIHAGVKYLDEQRERFEDTLGVADRTWFALAAYHSGFERVQAARRHARRMGLDGDRWFGNVEEAMLDISRNGKGKTAYRGASYTVAYVREIRSRFESYLQLQPATVVVAAS